LVRARDCSSLGRWFDSDDSAKKNENSNPYGFELHRSSLKGNKILFEVIKAINIISLQIHIFLPYSHTIPTACFPKMAVFLQCLCMPFSLPLGLPLFSSVLPSLYASTSVFLPSSSSSAHLEGASKGTYTDQTTRICPRKFQTGQIKLAASMTGYLHHLSLHKWHAASERWE